MTCERIDYYQAADRANVRRLVFNSVFFCALFSAVCSFIYFYLPSSDLNGIPAVASNSNVNVQEKVLPEESVAAKAPDADTDFIPASVPLATGNSKAVPAKFTRGAGTASLALKPTSVNRDDLGLLLYRQPQTRAAVEGFYYQVTGNREIAIAILDAADAYSIPLSLAFSLAYAESHFKPYASHVNKNGSIDRGLFQLNSTAFPNLSEAEFFDPKISAQKGLRHLNFFLKTAGKV